MNAWARKTVEMLYWSEHTENRLNILSEAEVIKANEQTGGLRECDLGHGRPIEHG